MGWLLARAGAHAANNACVCVCVCPCGPGRGSLLRLQVYLKPVLVYLMNSRLGKEAGCQRGGGTLMCVFKGEWRRWRRHRHWTCNRELPATTEAAGKSNLFPSVHTDFISVLCIYPTHTHHLRQHRDPGVCQRSKPSLTRRALPAISTLVAMATTNDTDTPAWSSSSQHLPATMKSLFIWLKSFTPTPDQQRSRRGHTRLLKSGKPDIGLYL